MKKLKNLGIKDSTVGLVIPTGYSFNLDGFSIYLTLGVIFIAQACNIDLSMPYFAIITFNSYSKQLTNTLLAVFKSSDETVPMITCNSGVVNT